MEEDLVGLSDESINDNMKNKKDKKSNVKNKEPIWENDDDSENNTPLLGKKKGRKLLDFVLETYRDTIIRNKMVLFLHMNLENKKIKIQIFMFALKRLVQIKLLYI